MAIEFYSLSEKGHKSLILQIEESDLLIVEDSLIGLQSLTGVNIDAYGKTKVHPEHVKLWLKLLESRISTKQGNSEKVVEIIIKVIRNTVQQHLGLLIIGD